MTDTTAQTAAAGTEAEATQTQQTQTFTQDDVNRIIADRVARVEKKYEGFAEIKARAAKFDEIEAQNATELEKAIQKADTDARADMSNKTNQRLIRAEVKAAAAAAKFHDPADAAVQLAGRFSDIKVTEDGDVDEATVKTLIEELAAAKPYLVKADSGRPQPLPGQGMNQTPPASGAAQGKAEAEKRFGKKPTQS